MLAEQVAAVRRFNRFHTRLVGALNDRLAYARASLPEARIVWELAQAAPGAGPAAKELAAALSVDPGYLSRLLAGLERQGLVARERDPRDARRRVLALTEAGRARFREMDEASAAEVSALLAPLAETERALLAGALDRARRLLGDGPGAGAAPVLLREPRNGDLGHVVSRQAALYAAEYGFDEAFEALLAEIAAAFIRNFRPGRERGWIAEIEGEIAGAVFVVREDDETAKLRMLYLEPWARGRGLGRALVEECLRFARAAGYRRMRLWTNDTLIAARRIYEATGFELTAKEPHDSFGVRMVGEVWAREL